MKLQRYHIGYDHTPEESAMMHDSGYWVKASDTETIIAKLKNCHNCAKQETCSLISRVCKEWEMR